MLTRVGNDPVCLKCKVNNKLVNFEIDTGSYLSTININELNNMKNVKVNPTYKRAKGYGNNKINFLGETDLTVKYSSISFIHNFLVVENSSVSLIGRDVCHKLNLKIALDNSDKHVNSINMCDILTKYKSYLSNNFKSCVKDKITLNIDKNVRPIFCKARTVPIRYRELVKKELIKLQNHGIITKVYNSQWACPTVNVLKSDGNIRICGDYSLTVNKCMDVVQYPLPL